MADYIVHAYNGSDSGDYDLRGQIGRIDRNLPLEEVVTLALSIMRQYGKREIVLSRTQPRGRKPGSWYIKGFKETRYTREEIEQRIEENRQNPKYGKRECYLITL